MSRKYLIVGFEFDENNENKLSDHKISTHDVRAVRDRDPLFFRNKKSGSGELVMIGLDSSGRLLTISLLQNQFDHEIWRPITGWESSKGERTLYGKK